MNELSQGARANKSGKILEDTIIPIMENYGFKVVSFSDWEKNMDKFGKELLLKNAPFTSIYDHKGRTEFLLKSEKYNLEIRIECKWQSSPGSVDEKFPYLYLNCVEAMSEEFVIIVLDGDGYKEGAKKWLRDAIDNKKYGNNKRIELFSTTDFIRWAKDTFS
jgi:hypothetical protein